MAKQMSPEELVETYFRGAKLYELGADMHDQKLQKLGIKETKKVLDQLDKEGPNGRDVLIDFLDPPFEPAIRVKAAQHLLGIVPERALAVLDDIDKNCPIHATSMTAFWAKMMYKLDNKG